MLIGFHNAEFLLYISRFFKKKKKLTNTAIDVIEFIMTGVLSRIMYIKKNIL